jgi:hypothetical protein
MLRGHSGSAIALATHSMPREFSGEVSEIAVRRWLCSMDDNDTFKIEYVDGMGFRYRCTKCGFLTDPQPPRGQVLR